MAREKRYYNWLDEAKEIQRMTRAEVVYNMASRGMSQTEIGMALGLSSNTISNNFRKEFHAGRRTLKGNIRHWQIKKAQEGDTPMLIHVGRVYCEDQKNTSEQDLEKGLLTKNIDVLCKVEEHYKQENQQRQEAKEQNAEALQGPPKPVHVDRQVDQDVSD